MDKENMPIYCSYCGRQANKKTLSEVNEYFSDTPTVTIMCEKCVDQMEQELTK